MVAILSAPQYVNLVPEPKEISTISKVCVKN